MSESVKPIKEILIPMDFSQTSVRALNFAMRIAETSDARLHLLYVDDDPGLIRPGTSQKVRDEFEDKMAMKFVGLLTPEQRDRYHTVMSVRCGTAYHEIETYAEEKSIDLIVLGTVGRSTIADMVLGSVANHVIRHAPCPVVSVRQQAHSAREESRVGD
jgi:nucleotide-binding universal stress UspA family protein